MKNETDVIHAGAQALSNANSSERGGMAMGWNEWRRWARVAYNAMALAEFKLERSTLTYLGDLQKCGLYGSTPKEVIEAVLLRGVREAIERGHTGAHVQRRRGEQIMSEDLSLAVMLIVIATLFAIGVFLIMPPVMP